MTAVDRGVSGALDDSWIRENREYMKNRHFRYDVAQMSLILADTLLKNKLYEEAVKPLSEARDNIRRVANKDDTTFITHRQETVIWYNSLTNMVLKARPCADIYYIFDDD